MFDISVYLDFVCFHFAFICFAFASFDCVILLSETYLYAVYFDEPGLKTLKITNRFSGYISLNNWDFKKLENMSLSSKKTDGSVSKCDKDLDMDGQLSEKIISLKKSRAGFKASLTKKTNDLRDLMTEESNMDEVKSKFMELLESWEKFEDIHKKLHDILTNDDEIDESLKYYEKENEAICEIKEKISMWIYAIESAKLQDEVTPLDSISQVNVPRASKSSKVSKVSHTSSSSSSVRRRLIEETANRKALEAKLKLLKEKQELAERKLQLQKIKEEEEFHLKQQEEMLKMKMELAQSAAREEVYAKAEANERGELSHIDEVEEQIEEVDHITNLKIKAEESPLDPLAPEWPSEARPLVTLPVLTTLKKETERDESFTKEDDFAKMMTIQERQIKCIEELVVQQQRSALTLTLPKPEVPVFSGDPIEYNKFVKAFETLIEARTDSDSARLYYLAQYTSGAVQELIQSCSLMDSDKGYQEARRLLKSRYGQPYKIASAYVDKVVNGPQIKSEDGEALQKFSVLLTSCRNTLKETKYLSKIDNPDSLRGIVNRLPYDARKRWRFTADNISEREDRQVTLDDIANFVEREARAATHPVFGDISGNLKDKESHKKKPPVRPKGSSFGTQTGKTDAKKDKQEEKKESGYSRPVKCIFCHSSHVLRECKMFQQKSYSEREEFAKKKGLCFNCLIPYHRARDCRKPAACTDCGGKHAMILHPPPPPNSERQSEDTNQSEMTGINNGFVEIEKTQCSSFGVSRSRIGLAVVPVKVKAEGSRNIVVTHAFLDGGSNSTFCTEALLKQLGLHGKKTEFSLTTIEKENSITKSSLVSLELFDLEEENLVELPTVFSVKSLPVSAEDVPKQDDVDRWPHLHGIQVSELDVPVGLLVGNDNIKALEPKEIRQSEGGGPYATKTQFGWAINGPLGSDHKESKCTANLIRTDHELNEQFKNFCNREFSECIADSELGPSQDDQRAISIMKKSVKLKDNHYEISLPWRDDQPCLPNSRPMALHRLGLLKKRLQRNSQLHGRYSTVIDDMLSKGYAQKVPEEEHNRQDGFVWYLPHHPVHHPLKPDKTRVVFDCSAKYRGTSLNDKLLQGPDLTNSLVGVLTRFRQEHIAMMADIESMFHQVRVTPEHCDALRFLWWPEGDLNQAPKDYRMQVHLFGATSSPSCANFGLRKVAEDNEEKFSCDVIETVKRNFYVDDCLKSVKTVDTAITLADQLTKLLQNGGFRLTKWVSNSKKVIESIPQSERAKSVKMLDFDHLPSERALGIQWNIQTDRFEFNINVKPKDPTRRGILAVVSSIYDPLGLAAPFVLTAKILLQDLCRRKLGWDDTIPGDDEDRWHVWLADLPKLSCFSVNRCIKPKNFSDIMTSQLHHFADASTSGYGAVTYLRLTDSYGNISCTLMTSKSRVVPLKQITIPRLELSAASIAIRLDKMMRRELELPIDDSVFWTDSTSVLKYIMNEDRRFHTFVANRVALIRDGSSPCQWRYIQSKQNPADDVSRGLTADALLGSSRWLLGPEFLMKTEDHWPKCTETLERISDEDPEVKKEAKAGGASQKEHPKLVEGMMKRFSSWHKLKKFIAWVLRYKENLRNARDCLKNPKDQRKTKIATPISVEEMQVAEREILKYVQRESFPEEIEILKSKETDNEKICIQPQSRTKLIKKSSAVYKLDPRLVDGLLIVGGRLRSASIPESAKHQVIMPKDNHVSNLIIQYYHLASGHSGREHVLSLLRERFWVIRANSAVRRLLSRCFSCRRRQAPVAEQKMANLPADRVTANKPPFTFVGVDFFGPFIVKRGRSEVKRYGCIFTCMTIRAVHIEVTHSLDTDSFVQALRRFIGRRGKPEQIRSDNGGNFVKGSKEISNAISEWNHQKIDAYLLQHEVQWIFNPPTGSHHGGTWERCIRTVRKVLNAILNQQILDDEGLSTLLVEVESIINSRPITQVSEDPKDLEALTPNHLLLLRSEVPLTPGVFRKEDLYSKRRWRQVQYLADQFWKRWSKEYLPLLQTRSKWHRERRNLSVGDIVLLVDDTCSRNAWPLARIIETFPNSDGYVRRVKVKTKGGVLMRPIDKCVLLEADQEKTQ